jgi:hypothetical protein
MQLAARNSGNYTLNKNDQTIHTPKKANIPVSDAGGAFDLV